MNKTNIDQALAALADALKGSEPSTFLDNPKEFVKKIPHRSLSGDHINGGKVQNFSSTGISDTANSTVLSVSDAGIAVEKFSKGFDVYGNVKINELNCEVLDSSVIMCDVLRTKNIEAEITYSNTEPITFKSDNLEGKGILWAGQGYTKQLIFATNPDRIFISETVDLPRGKGISINNIKVLDENSLGTSITKSYLKEVGRLKGLIVDGSVSISDYLYFDANTNRLGLGTEQPNAAITLIENDVEVILGAKENSRAFIGTFASHAIDIVTDNQSRINISSDGNIILGNFKAAPVQVSINGKLSIRVNNPDPEVDLHINGSIKFGGKLQTHGTESPKEGYYNKADIVWNTDPRIGSYAGWICIQPGSPGVWEPFGKIGNQ